MKITEIVANIFCYLATIRVKRGKSSVTVRTVVFADGSTQARAMLAAMYGVEAVVSVSRIPEDGLNEAALNRASPRVTPRVLPTTYQQSLVQNALLNQLKLQALRVRPTRHDLAVAKSNFEAEQKRVDREYEEALKSKERWADIRKRRLKNNFRGSLPR